jgi:hypothetical protein
VQSSTSFTLGLEWICKYFLKYDMIVVFSESAGSISIFRFVTSRRYIFVVPQLKLHHVCVMSSPNNRDIRIYTHTHTHTHTHIKVCSSLTAHFGNIYFFLIRRTF